ncbi:hypothetical protein [Pseudomonas mediterranea]|uniref:Uncharacterized protein n=1 Tax=Pseudomonas mediterranea TaxID=183795 RepID=A0AAX2DIR5_9PSED|nr:hypothetical protein [Pseudomonas mediterranea]KGU84843.1 hypothetical protein N005_15895 [Pseudomonas mediterranea CFBP 5447]SDU74732.1 hypothetical protein SAMN05216476_5272 [Pseudomonas mediterranea]
MMILLDPITGLAVNPEFVRSIRLADYNGTRHLVITMEDGFEIQIAHNPLQGINVHELHRKLLEAV